MTRVRPIVEGFAHIVCVVLDPTFETHERGRLRRLPMEKALPAAKRHLPTSLSALADHLKNLGNTFHHNQGTVQRSSPNAARGALLQCAELFTWMDAELLDQAPPLEYAEALRELESAAPVATPLPSSTATPMPVPSPAPAAARPPATKAGSLWPGILGGFALVLLVIGWLVSREGGAPAAASAGTSSAPDLAPVEAYNAAIASKDVDRILAIHALPTSRFFMAKNQNEAQLRKLYEGWFRSSGKTRDTGFRNCQSAGTSADGSRAFRCDTYVDPPLEKGVSVVAACLVFNSTGRLTSRTELSVIPGCPPAAP